MFCCFWMNQQEFAQLAPLLTTLPSSCPALMVRSSCLVARALLLPLRQFVLAAQQIQRKLTEVFDNLKKNLRSRGSLRVRAETEKKISDLDSLHALFCSLKKQ